MLLRLLKALKLARKFAKMDVERVRKIIINHSLGAAAAAVAAGWVPGAGGAIATGISMGFTLSMYYRLCGEMGIQISKNKLKAIASVAVAEVAAYLVIVIAAETLLTFIPGIGSLGASALSGVCNFAMVYIAGALFIKLMVVFASTGEDISSMSEEELKAAMKAEADKKTIEDTYKESKKVYKETKNDSRYDKNDSSSMN